MADNIFTGATNSNWGLTTNWSQATIPTASDGHITKFTAASPNCTVNASNRVCNALDFTGYTNTITFSTLNITVSGAVTLSSGMTQTGTGSLIMNTTANLTFGGYTYPGTLQLTGTSRTYTLQDSGGVGNLILSGTTALTLNNNGTAKTIVTSGDLTTSSAGVTGTAQITMIGTGLLSTSGAIRNNFDINTAGTITLGSSLRYSTGTFTIVAIGTLDTTTNSNTFTIGLASATTTLNTSLVTWNNLASGGSGTFTLTSNLEFAGTYTNTGTVSMNGNTLVARGTLITGGSAILSGTTVCRFAGSSPAWSAGSGSLRLTTNVDCSGTLTITGICNYATGTFTYITGTVVTTGSTFTLLAATTINTAGIVFDNAAVASGIITINSLFTCSGTLTLGATGSPSFIGSSGFTVANLTLIIANRTCVLLIGRTYTVTTYLFLRGTRALPVSLQSSTASSTTAFILDSGALCHVSFVSATDIDSSGGRLITNVKGTLVRTTNWYRTNPDMFLII